LIRPAVAASLVYYTSDEKQKEWLRDLLSRERKDQYKAVIEDRRQSILSLLLGSLSSCKLPLEALLQIVPVMQPRYYTISSSSSLYPSKPHITVAITEEEVKSGGRFVGQCSALLKRLDGRKSSDGFVRKNLRIFIKESSFRLPPSLATPIILIGPGTGFAPMRALLQERRYLRDQASSSKNYGATTLYFGCKSRDLDHIYRDEMGAFVAEGIVTAYHVAYSREQQKKVYVQDLMVTEANAKAIMNDLQSGAFVYVCGATAMGSDVHRALLQILSSHGEQFSSYLIIFIFLTSSL
jgi:NADPH-ferrihemoprotein reductase